MRANPFIWLDIARFNCTCYDATWHSNLLTILSILMNTQTHNLARHKPTDTYNLASYTPKDTT